MEYSQVENNTFIILFIFKMGTDIAFVFHFSFQNLREYQLIGSFFPIGWIYSEFSRSVLIPFFLLVNEYTRILSQLLNSEMGSFL